MELYSALPSALPLWSTASLFYSVLTLLLFPILRNYLAFFWLIICRAAQLVTSPTLVDASLISSTRTRIKGVAVKYTHLYASWHLLIAVPLWCIRFKINCFCQTVKEHNDPDLCRRSQWEKLVLYIKNGHWVKLIIIISRQTSTVGRNLLRQFF